MVYFSNLSNKKGFTLLELLVVVSIIALLASVVITSMQTTRKKSRDGARIQQMQQYMTALQLHHSQNGNYPGTTGWTCLGGNYSNGDCWGTTYAGSQIQSALTPYILEYAPVMEAPGTNGGYGAIYTSAGGNSYELRWIMEVTDTCTTGSACAACRLAGSTKAGSAPADVGGTTVTYCRMVK